MSRRSMERYLWSRNLFKLATLVVMVASLLSVSASAFAQSRGVLFYNATDGTGATGRVDINGNFVTLQSLADFSIGWTHIAGTDQNPGILLFYNANDGTGATGRVDIDGNFVTVQSFSGFSLGWTHIVATQISSTFDYGLLFYNANDGTGATGRVDINGDFVTLQTLSGFSIDWTHVASR